MNLKKIYYWENLSEILWDFLIKNNLNPIDIYLVGSTLKGSGFEKDIDSIVIIDNPIDLIELRNLKQKAYYYLQDQDLQKIYHFKLFNLSEWYKFGSYDGFRLREFQKTFISLKGRELILDVKPILNLENFCNSVVIEVVYLHLVKNQFFNRRLALRIKRNLEFVSNFSFLEAMQFCDSYVLLRHFNEVKYNKFKLFSFLKREYFRKFRHEFINQYYFYLKLIKEKF